MNNVRTKQKALAWASTFLKVWCYLLHQIDIHCIDVAIEHLFGFVSCFFIIASFDFVRVNFIVKILNIHLVKVEVSLARQADHAPILRTDMRCSLTLEYRAFGKDLPNTPYFIALNNVLKHLTSRANEGRVSSLLDLCWVQPRMAECNFTRNQVGMQVRRLQPSNIKDYATREFRLLSA